MMLSTQLKLLKEKRKLTNQQLSDLSGVPVGTINRILSGQTDNPSFQTVCDMVMAMDGSLDELVGIQQEIPQAEKKARASQEILSLYEAMIESKNKWLHRLFVCCCVLTLVLYGAVMNTASVLLWSHSLQWELIAAACAAGLPMDLLHGGSTALLLYLLADPVQGKLDRMREKYGWGRG